MPNNPIAADEQLNGDSNDGLQPTTRRKKRPQVSVACVRCRQRKIKCDAVRPSCWRCTNEDVVCDYETEVGETSSQALKRKYIALSEDRDLYKEVYDRMHDEARGRAIEILDEIRSGRTPKEVLDAMNEPHQNSVQGDPTKLAINAFLIGLAHSTGSLQEIVSLGVRTMHHSAEVLLPEPECFLRLQHQIVYISRLEELLDPARRSSPQPISSSLENATANDTNQQGTLTRVKWAAPHSVRAAHWTLITPSDEAVSHLVSLFLAWINPTWRFVEEDLFLRGMRSGNPDSLFCSPFLVNSICAIASLHSEHDVAFIGEDRKRITRGQHFHDEALRLWALEEYRPSVTNIQALCILALESNYRAKDKLGLTLVRFAAQLNHETSFEQDVEEYTLQGISQRDFARARVSAHWTSVCTHIIMRIAFMNPTPTTPIIGKVPKIDDVFDDSLENWTGYPLTRSYVAHRPTLYLRERCKLAKLFQEMHHLMLVNRLAQKSSEQYYASKVDELSVKLRNWYQMLPFELQYHWPMSVAVWELHASYIAFLMILWLSTNNHNESFDPPTLQGRMRDAISLAHQAAQMLRDFRIRYGLKITPAWLLQLQAVAAGVLVLDPALKSPANLIPAASAGVEGKIEDSHAAFEEVFRCLLGTGVEVMIARGIARMMYHTALEQNIVLSRSTRAMLSLMSSTAWRPADLSLVNSAFPNFAKAHDDAGSERMTELLSKWEFIEI